MLTEVEAKYLNVDHQAVRARLLELGAVCEHPMRLMRRTLFDYPDRRLQKDNYGWLRVRDEGDKLTITYKSHGASRYSDEIETTIGSYQKMSELIAAIGLEAYARQESKRETWRLVDVEIVLDEWPWLNPYIEIEGHSETAIMECSHNLGFEWQEAVFGSVDRAYQQQYPGMTADESIGIIPEVRFNSELPLWLKQRQK